MHDDLAPRLLNATALFHAGLAVVFAALLAGGVGPTITGVPAALKPLKFAISIALYLATMALLVPLLDLGPRAKLALAAVFAGTMLVETLCLTTQAVRGTTSHFNAATPFDAAVWSAMGLAITLTTLAMAATALVATFRPLSGTEGVLPPLLATAWRAGLWIFLLTAVSGYAMGGRLQHGVGGPDGGPGLTFLNWSVTHGDLRVSHFVAMHAIQVLPLLALALLRVPLGAPWRAAALGLAIVAMGAGTVVTLGLAFEGRPLIRAGRFLDAEVAAVGRPERDGHDGVSSPGRGAPDGGARGL